jgi:hypothetical protein
MQLGFSDRRRQVCRAETGFSTDWRLDSTETRDILLGVLCWKTLSPILVRMETKGQVNVLAEIVLGKSECTT